VVDLVVAGVHDAATRRLEDDRDRVGDGVRHADELGRVGPDPRRTVLGHGLDELRVPKEPVLVELRLDEAERQPGGPDLGDAHLAQEVRKRTDVIFVSVREHDGADVALVLP
jgi:hypothetical protein